MAKVLRIGVLAVGNLRNSTGCFLNGVAADVRRLHIRDSVTGDKMEPPYVGCYRTKSLLALKF
jgi:hypothetical protein